MRAKLPLNDKWEFRENFDTDMLSAGELKDACSVRIPHTVKELPYHYFDDVLYQMVSGYRRIFTAPEEWRGKRVFVQFMAVAHSATLYLNGEELCEHRCGYTAFEAELTQLLRYGSENVLTLKVNSREDQNIPPFGYAIDYMTYGGIYREVYLYVTEDVRISELWVQPEEPGGVILPEGIPSHRFTGRVELEISLDAAGDLDPEELTLKFEIRGHKLGDLLITEEQPFSEAPTLEFPDAKLWDSTAPNLYDLKLMLYRGETLLDEAEECFGFRRSEFREDGYYLNGRKFKLRGLNRHQSYAYAGYAMPAAPQKLDADILRFELGVNAVRTSHYPQSRHFIRRCDELGLLVFTEIPGWQHIGDQAWKEQTFVNLEEMILQYRNHPSVILWGVRINESVDDDDFYEQTNAMAHALDPTRPTGGVRYLEKSHLLEDVYTFNDFSHEGTAPGCKKKAAVTPDMGKAYLISEYNGHMFPTKAFDDEEHRLEHALRHANVLDAVNENKDIAGSFGWCMFDYNTHKDFGSGDRICYHGVTDMFRNPKLAAAVYASQQNRIPVLEVGSSMDIGEHPGGNRGNIYIFTNADSVRMYRNDVLIKEYTEGDPKYSHLRHAPILIDDYVGDQMKEEEGFTDHQNRIVKSALNHIARYGMNNIPLDVKLKLAQAMTVYHMSFETAYALYGKYVGNWGGKATTFRFDAIKDGEVVKSVTKTTTGRLCLNVRVDHSELCEGDTYDVATLRVRVCDEYGNVQPFFNTPLDAELSGPIEFIGPKRVQIAGGMGGAYVRTLGSEGEASIRLSLPEEYAGEAETEYFYVRIAK
ncbi:MAG: glycoside hydrolase family 2 protein [Lachnospiraceae bacterium]|nr:glycoside hydrolase family 2 protein [Lachnospiraceae bacterium]